MVRMIIAGICGAKVNPKICNLGVSAITLKYDTKPVAILRTPEFYYQRKEERCSRQFGTNNINHPYIKVCLFGFMTSTIYVILLSPDIDDTRIRPIFGWW